MGEEGRPEHASLQAAIAVGEVRHAWGYFLAALDRDWTEQTAIRPIVAASRTPQDPTPVPPDDRDRVAALTGVGVTPEAAARLARDNPDSAPRPLRCLPCGSKSVASARPASLVDLLTERACAFAKLEVAVPFTAGRGTGEWCFAPTPSSHLCLEGIAARLR